MRMDSDPPWIPVRGGAARLRDVRPEDLDHFFEHQREPEGRYMLGFGAPDPNAREDFDAKWSRHLTNPEIQMWTIGFRADGQPSEQVAGAIMTFYRSADGPIEMGYHLGRAFWGRGIASKAVAEVLKRKPERPFAARCISDNLASRRVLLKNGFVETAREEHFGPARGCVVEETLFRLDERR